MWLHFVVALSWTTAILASYRSYWMHVTSIKTPRVRGDHYAQVDSVLSCFINYCLYAGSLVITYNVTSGQCGLYTNQIDTLVEDGSRLLCFNISPPYVRSFEQEVSSAALEIKRFIVVPGSVTWKQAYYLCWNLYEGLAQIDSPDKQLMAEERLRDADGLQTLAIGVYWHSGEWIYTNKSRVTYTHWAPNHPIGWFGAIAKHAKYRWIGAINFDGCLCQSST